MAKYLVTGGAGFVGSHLVEQLLKNGHSVRVLDNLSTGKRENVPATAEFIVGDVGDAQTVLQTSQGVDGVFHLAANPSVPKSLEDPVGTFRTNVMGTLHVLDAVRRSSIRRVIVTSSSAVYGDQPVPHSVEAKPHPMSPYGLHKLMGEQLARQFSDIYGLQTVVLRPFNIYGSRMPDTGPYASVIKIFLRQRRESLPLTIVGDGEQTRDFVHVNDVVRAYVTAMTNTYVGKGEIFNIGTGRARTVNEVAAIIGGPVEHIPPRAGDILHSVADIEKTKILLKWQPQVEFVEGLNELLRSLSA